MSETDAARDAVTELEQALGWLTGNLYAGTGLPHMPEASAEKRAERADERARVDREARHGQLASRTVMVPLGESPVPLDLTVMDLLSEVLATADELADLVSDAAGWPRLASATSAFADPGPYLFRVRAALPKIKSAVCGCHCHVGGAFRPPCDIPGGCGTEHGSDDLPRIVKDRCDALVFRAHMTLGIFTDGQLLAGICPWCNGRTSKHPVGGAKTLRIRLLPVVRNPKVEDPQDIPAVVCESGLCEPPESDVGSWYRLKYPAWPLFAEGEWLARQIEAAALQRAQLEAEVDEIVTIAS